jgi:hypothetical protein
MSNGARHGLGVVIGLLVTPVVALCLTYSATKFSEYFRYFFTRGGDRWLAAGLVLVAAVLVGLVVGSRVSPVASLIPGFVYAAVGAFWVVSPREAFGHSGRDLLPHDVYLGYTVLGPYGIFLMLGVALLVASVAPSRWQARRGAAPRFGGPPPAPMGPPPMHGAQAPMGAPQPPPAPGQSPPWQGMPQGTPQYGAPPAQPASPNPPALPSAPPEAPRPSSSSGSDDDDNPGEWTQMYGGNRPK